MFTAQQLFAVVQRLNWLYGRGDLVRLEDGYAVVKPFGMREEQFRFTIIRDTAKHRAYVRFRRHVRRIR